ncbi:MAG: chemotaxis protein CheW [Deltaproteobacteria bacterium]|nr:chemotaxis protein CheW [Deltaproteobacteria bacterium]
MIRDDSVVERLARMRKDFDDRFTRPIVVDSSDRLELIAVRAQQERYAIAVSQISAVLPSQPVAHVPVSLPGFVGLGAVQGRLVAVYDLGVLLARKGAPTPRRWLLICRADPEVAFGIDDVDGYLRVAKRSIVVAPPSATSEGHAGKIVEDGGVARPIVDLESALAELRRNLGGT